jgi:hypothetical protein
VPKSSSAKLAAEFLERIDEAVRLREARDRGGLGDFEADLRGVEAAALELVDDEGQELVVAQALAGEVDRAHRQAFALVGLRHQPAEGVGRSPSGRCSASGRSVPRH